MCSPECLEKIKKLFKESIGSAILAAAAGSAQIKANPKPKRKRRRRRRIRHPIESQLVLFQQLHRIFTPSIFCNIFLSPPQ